MKDDINKKNKIRGIRIRTFNTCMIVLSCVVFIFVILNITMMPKRYHTLVEHTDEYIACEKDAAMLNEASDYLTEQVRLYAQNMDIRNMELYFEEANVTMRREKALADLEKHDAGEAAQESLQAALKSSNDLMVREIYSMKLISVANGYSEDILPQEVKEMQLKAEDTALGYDAMVEKARALVFDSGYQDAKLLIDSHLSHFLNSELEFIAQRQKNSEKDLADALFQQRILISLLFVMNVLTFGMITILIIKPLGLHIKRIKDNDVLEIIGAYEFKYLALTYNDIYEVNEANKRLLTEQAEKDGLTGVFNRSTFEGIKSLLKESQKPIGLAMIDVDHFKEVNDNNGHEIGDLALKRVAKLLTESFRTTDYVIRYGGDEFVIILLDINYDNSAVIQKKFEWINEELHYPKNGVPPLSLSIGVSFSENGFTDDLLHEADAALYSAKEAGRNNCKLYREKSNISV